MRTINEMTLNLLLLDLLTVSQVINIRIEYRNSIINNICKN